MAKPAGAPGGPKSNEALVPKGACRMESEGMGLVKRKEMGVGWNQNSEHNLTWSDEGKKKPAGGPAGKAKWKLKTT